MSNNSSGWCLSPNTKLNADQTVAVDPEYFWRQMDDCPHGIKVQLLSQGGVAVYGVYRRGDTFWKGWAPLPKQRKENDSISGHAG